MRIVQKGDKVKLSYRLVLAGGDIYETSEKMGDLEFTVGEGRVMAPIEEGVAGMKVGDFKAIRVTAEQGYGPHKPERVFHLPKSKAPVHFAVGKSVELYRADGMAVPVKIVGENEEAFFMDGNHPLAGQALTFEVTLVSIE